MILRYIFHSGFLLETSQCILVFDYWMDPAGVMSVYMNTCKPVYVFQVTSMKTTSQKKSSSGRIAFPMSHTFCQRTYSNEEELRKRMQMFGW